MSDYSMPREIRFVLATIFINAIGFGIIMPVLPQLVMELGDASLSEATAIGGFLSLTYAATQFVCGPLSGNLSDRFGRRPVLLGSTLGFAIDFLLMAFAPSLLWLFVGRFLSGVFGASNAPAQSSIADLAPPEARSRFFSYISAAFGIGFVLGPALGGLLSTFGHRAPFYAAGALALINFLYGLVAFRETLDAENRRPFQWTRANPVGSLLNVRKLPGILPIATVYFLWQVATLIYPLIWNYYTIGRYGWTSGQVGLSLAAVGVGIFFVQAFLTGRLAARFGERRTAEIGIVLGGYAMFAVAFSPYGWLAWLSLIPMAFQSMVHPMLTAMMSRRATASTQGEIQGFASSVMALGALAAPLIFNPAMAWFTGPDAPFLFYGVSFVIAGSFALLALVIIASLPKAHQPPH